MHLVTFRNVADEFLATESDILSKRYQFLTGNKKTK